MSAETRRADAGTPGGVSAAGTGTDGSSGPAGPNAASGGAGGHIGGGIGSIDIGTNPPGTTASTGSAGPNASPAPAGTADSGATRGLLTSRLFWAGYGTALAVMGTRLPLWTWPPDSVQPVELAFTIVLFAVLAQPYTGRPVLASFRFHHLARAHRNTLLPAAFVILVATEKPPAWAAGVDALLLAGYLLLTDALSLPPAVLRRIASPGSLLSLAALIAGATALVALPASAGAYRPVLAAAGAAAAIAAAVATAFGSAEERRVGSPGTEHQNQDRSSE